MTQMLSPCEFDSEDELIGLDISLDQGMQSPIGCIVEVNTGDNDEITEDTEVVISEHLRDETHTVTLFDSLGVSIPHVGEEYTVYWRETLTNDGDWIQTAAKSMWEHRVRDAQYPDDIDAGDLVRNRIRSETYQVGADHCTKFSIRITDDGVSCTLTGRSDLATCIAALTVDSTTEVYVDDNDYDGVQKLYIEITDISPDPSSFSASIASDTVDTNDLPDEYVITGTDVFGGDVVITYDNSTETATVERTANSDSSEDSMDSQWALERGFTEPPEKLSGDLCGLDDYSTVEFFDIPWFDDIKELVTVPDTLDTGNVGVTVGDVYVSPDNNFELHHASIKPGFKKNRSTINDIVTENTPYTFKIES